MKSAASVISDLEKRGVHLEVEDGNLKYRAPKGSLTESDIVVMRTLKAELIGLVADRTLPLGLDLVHRYDPFPLTDIQQAYLTGSGDAYQFGGTGCHGYMELELAKVDPSRLDDAWSRVLEKHDMLHSIVDGSGFQFVKKDFDRERLAVRTTRTEKEYREAVLQSRRELDHKQYEYGTTKHCDLHLNVMEPSGSAILHLSIDLMICDFLSITIILSDLASFYDFIGDESTEPEMLFRDCVVRTNEKSLDTGNGPDAAYWAERVEELPGHPDLPTLKDADTRKHVRFERKQLVLHPHEWASFKQSASSRGITASTAILTGYAAILAEWSAERRFTLNMTTLNRVADDPRTMGVVGDFTSIVLVEADCAAPAAFSDRCREVQERIWTDLEHQGVSGIEVLRAFARKRRSEGLSTLAPIVFTSSVGLGAESRIGVPGGLFDGAKIVGGLSQTPQVWLDCQAMEWNGELVVNWDIRCGVFPDGMVDDAFGVFAEAIENLARDDESWDGTERDLLAFKMPGERLDANRTRRDLRPATLTEAFEAKAKACPDAPAVTSGQEEYSYGQLLADASTLACRLHGRGTVAIMIGKCYLQIVAAVGAAMAGATYIPIDPLQPTARRNAIMDDAHAEAVLVDESDLPAAIPVGIEVIVVGFGTKCDDLIRGAARPDDIAYVIYTSGTTGTPKGVAMSHRAAMNTISDINDRLGMSPDDSVLGLASLTFDLSVFDIFGTLSFGGKLVLPDPEEGGNPSHWAKLIEENSVTVWNSVPQQMQMLSNFIDDARVCDVSSLRVAMLSGDWIPVSLPDEVRFKIPGIEIVSLGGATEAGIWSVCHVIGVVAPGAKSIPYGKPLSNQTMDVVDIELRSRPTWVPGEILIAGDSIAEGYLGDRDLTEQKFMLREGARCYRTGDIGRYLPSGDIEFLGRVDQQVKVLGHRVELGEIESALVSDDSVSEAAVVAVGPERRLCAVVVPAAFSSVDREAFEKTIKNVRSYANELSREVPWKAIEEYQEKIALISLNAIGDVLRDAGLADSFSLDEAMSALGASERYRGLVSRWLAALSREGFATEGQGRYSVCGKPTRWDIEKTWTELKRSGSAIGYKKELVDYLQASCRSLPHLLKGEKSALALLFPEGEIEVAQAAYGENPTSEYLNRILERLAVLESDGSAGFRVLELGAGTGGSSDVLVAALEGRCSKYYYTDISTFFFQEAKHRYGERSWIDYVRLDLNEDFLGQGVDQNSFDLVIAANVLHNASDIVAALLRIKAAIAPGGLISFIEATEERPSMLVSVDFQRSLNEGFDDVRSDSQAAFLDEVSWKEACISAGFDCVECLPGIESQSILGQALFVAQAKGGKASVCCKEVRERASRLLPAYMIPEQIRILDELPLSKNGKVDRKKLETDAERTLETTSDSIACIAVEGRLEQAVAAAFEEVLGRGGIGPKDDFFRLGGDSLQATKLIGVLRKTIPEAGACEWEWVLRNVMRNPTVQGIADILRNRGASQAPEPKRVESFVWLNDVEGDEVVVLVHEGAGALEVYAPLLNEIGDRFPVAGLQVIDEESSYLDMDPRTLVEDLGARYAELLAAVDGLSRVKLVGFCFGGLVAIEIARNLLERSRPVSDLVIISGYGYPYVVDDEILIEYPFAKEMGADTSLLGYPDEEFDETLTASLRRTPGHLGLLSGTGDASEKLRELDAVPQQERLRRIAACVTDDPDGIASLVGQFPTFRQSLKAVSEYRPDPYLGDVLYLRDEGEADLFSVLDNDALGFWEGVVLGDLQVKDISGDHFTCMSASFSEDVARKAGLL